MRSLTHQSGFRARIPALATLALVLVCDALVAAPLPAAASPAADHTPTSVIVKVRPGFLPAEIDRIPQIAAAQAANVRLLETWCAAHGADRVAPLWTGADRVGTGTDHPAQRLFVLGVAPGGDAEEVAARLSAQPWVEYAEVDRLFELHQAPNDPLFDRQWPLENTGQPYWAIVGIPGLNNDTLAETTGTPGADVNFLAAFNHPEPKADVLVAVIDTGVDPDHEDLHDRMAVNHDEIPDNGVDDDHNGFIDDVYGWDFSGDSLTAPNDITGDSDPRDDVGHGTHVAGTIAATVDNGVGIAGVSDRALIVGVKIFPNAYFSVTARAVYYAVSRGVRVINMSWGGGFQSRVLREALDYARTRGVVPVASIGNSGSELVFYPAGYPQTIAVGSLHAQDGLSSFSTYNEFIDVVAPGQQILSLRAAGTDLYADVGEAGSYIIEDKYLIASGTSMAAPHVSGAAAVLLSIAPGLAPERVREILRATAYDILDPLGKGADLVGWDKYTGAGRIDLAAAVAALPGVHAVIDEPRPEAWVGGQITIHGSATGSAFAGYDIRVAPGHTPQPADWTTIASRSVPVTSGALAVWDTDSLSGPYTIWLDAGSDAQITVPVRLVQKPTAAVRTPAAGDTVRLLGLISGTAAAPGFQSYHLEAEGPLPGDRVFVIAESSVPVWDDTLALWRTDSLEAGTYRLSLTITTAGESLTDSLTVVVRAPFAPGWPVTLPAVAHFAIRSVNLDGVGDDEIICPTSSGLWVFRSDGKVYPGWPRGNGADFSTAPAVADLDHDGKFEVIVAGPTRMHVFAFIGEAFEGWPRPFESIQDLYGGSVPTVGNLDGRGNLEIAAINRTGQIRVWNANGTNYIPQRHPDFGTVDIDNSQGNSLPTVTVCDLNNDGRNELIVAGDDIHVFDGLTGDPFGDNPETRIASHLSVNGTAIGDFNDDGLREIAYAFGDADSPDRNFGVNLIDANGHSLSGWPRILPQTVNLHLLYSIAAGDVDGDRIPEIFVAPYSLGEGFLYGFHADGTPVGSDSSDGLLALLPGSVSAIGLVDIDLDEQPEIIARVGEILSGPDWVYAIEADGGVVPGYPISFGYGATFAPSAPIIGDLNHDGMADMVTVQSTDRVLTVWELGTTATPRARPWPQFRADRWNSGVIATPQYDLVHLMRIVNVIFRGGAPLPPYEPSDLNCDGIIDISDIIRLTDFLYRFGAAPCVP